MDMKVYFHKAAHVKVVPNSVGAARQINRMRLYLRLL